MKLTCKLGESGIDIRNVPGRFPVTLNFDNSCQVGWADVYIKDGVLYGTISIDDDHAGNVKIGSPRLSAISRGKSYLLTDVSYIVVEGN